MSSVRMCDNPKCADLFSELEEGWSTSQQVQVIEDQGQRKTVSITIDLCPDCSGDTKKVAARLSEARRTRRSERLALEDGKGSRNVRNGRGAHARDKWDDEPVDERP
jgi:hypothetical protein